MATHFGWTANNASSTSYRATRRALLALSASMLLPATARAAAAAGPIAPEPPGPRGGHLIVAEARKHRKKKYANRGIGPKRFNCAGFTYYVVKKSLRIDISFYLDVQMRQGKQVSRQAIQAGDLVFFKGTQGNKQGPTHVGIALGNSKMIHAANKDQDVTVDPIDRYRQHYLEARRLVS